MWGEAWASLVRRGLESAIIPNINIMIKHISIITDTEWSVWLENEMLLSSGVFRHLLMPLIWNSNLGNANLKFMIITLGASSVQRSELKALKSILAFPSPPLNLKTT